MAICEICGSRAANGYKLCSGCVSKQLKPKKGGVSGNFVVGILLALSAPVIVFVILPFIQNRLSY